MRIYLFLALTIFSLVAYSDQTPDWENYKITSKNGKWAAFLSRDYTESAKNPWEDTWTLSVYKAFQYPVPGPNQIPIWSRPYDSSGYSEGYLSDDGKIFVYVEYWFYKNHPIVKVFREDCKIFKGGSYFNIGKNLEKTTSHELWLKEGSITQIVSKDSKPYIKIETVAGDRYVKAFCE